MLYGEGVATVEWFDRLLPAAGDDVLLVTLRYAGGNRRAARGPRPARLLAAARGA